MGNSYHYPRTFNKQGYIDYHCLKFDRILDADNQVYIGIAPGGNGLRSQAIRIGDFRNKYHRLLGFTEEEYRLYYKFENNITMSLKKQDYNIHMEIKKEPNKVLVSKNIDPIILKMFKPIKLNNTSNEIDKIKELFSKVDSEYFIGSH